MHQKFIFSVIEGFWHFFQEPFKFETLGHHQIAWLEFQEHLNNTEKPKFFSKLSITVIIFKKYNNSYQEQKFGWMKQKLYQ